jgi:hypothetical protein
MVVDAIELERLRQIEYFVKLMLADQGNQIKSAYGGPLGLLTKPSTEQ